MWADADAGNVTDFIARDPNMSCGGTGDQQGEDAAPVSAAANEYDLDDEELLALAATQLKGS